MISRADAARFVRDTVERDGDEGGRRAFSWPVGPQLAAAAEAEFGFTLLDTVTTTEWDMLRTAGAPRRLRGWSRLFAAD